MKYLLILSCIIISFFMITLGGCCSCTEIACTPASSPILSLNIDLADYPNLTAEDVREIEIVRTDFDFNRIDSVGTGFFPIAFEATQHVLQLAPMNFNRDIELLNFNLILKNNALNQVDTISNINYDIIETEEVCNTCSGGFTCDDETYIVRRFENGSFSFNKNEFNSFTGSYLLK